MQSNPESELVFEVSVDPRNGSYVANARAFGIIATGDTMQELRINALDAVDDYFDDTMPQPTRVRFLYPAGDMLVE
ncbi:MAG: hypothetical protein OXN15_06180 [Chloroflexota bacterium]|nr:hypothetical protein [Chloroflexota bacterium]MDE2969133.1 hypothetical protein [Chloroflexota bacterium]